MNENDPAESSKKVAFCKTWQSEDEPLIIDNGSYKCRVGWRSSEKPVLEFRNLIAKPRKDRRKENADLLNIPDFQIGNEINIEALRMQLKTQFDRNVITNFHNQEKIMDYIFAQLGIDQEPEMLHPIVLTEAIANPNYCRQQINEMLFECYNVPAVCYGIDSLFSLKRNALNTDALVISFGYYTTHVVPVLDGKLQLEHVRRINVGGYHVISYLYRLMQMKYPVHLNAITISRVEGLLHEHCAVAVDYLAELRKWAGLDFYNEHVQRIQLPYTALPQPGAQSIEQRIEKRKELARRLVESNARRAREKLQEEEEQLQLMQIIREYHDCGDMMEFESALETHQLTSLQEVDKLITTLSAHIKHTKQKLQEAADNAGSSNVKEKPPIGPHPPPGTLVEKWVADIRDKKAEILQRKKSRKARRQEMVKRHTPAAQERMRIISLLAHNEKGVDEFGMDDNDWNVYKVINRYNDSDSEHENEMLLEYENILQKHEFRLGDNSATLSNEAENYQLHFGVESIRAPEVFFQPSLIGNSEAGLAELIEFVLKFFAAGEQQRLVNNIFLTGGSAKYPGLRERLNKELLERRPFQSTFNISEAKLPELDAWLGARDFSKTSDFSNFLTTKQEFAENGPEYFKTHSAGNFYFPTPRE